MNVTAIHRVFLLGFFLLLTSSAYNQESPEKKDTVHAPNAGFDVIIKRNGDLVYGLVLEVGQTLIRYKRTDIPDGPVYVLNRSEVYAISYRNQVKDVLNPLDSFGARMPQYRQDSLEPYYSPLPPVKNRFSLSRMGMVRFGLGFIRGFTKVENANDYSSSISFPIISIAYDALYRPNLRLGGQLAFGPHKFSREEYIPYDSMQTSTSLKENIFTLHVYARYTLGNALSRLQPYLMGGIGLHTSYIRSDQQITFLEHTNQVLQIKSGRRSVGLGLLGRIGTDYYLNPQFRIFGDVGAGPSILQVGVAAFVQ